MYDEKESVILNGNTTIDGKVIERYSATIDSQNPENMMLSRTILDPQVRKENREECRANQALFEDDAYAMQDQMEQTDSKVANNEASVETSGDVE